MLTDIAILHCSIELRKFPTISDTLIERQPVKFFAHLSSISATEINGYRHAVHF